MSLCTQSNTSIKTTSYWHHGRRSDLRLTPDWRTWCQYDVVLTLYQNGIIFTSCVSIRRQIDAYDVILISIVLKIFERFRVSIWHYIDDIKCVDPTSEWRTLCQNYFPLMSIDVPRSLSWHCIFSQAVPSPSYKFLLPNLTRPGMRSWAEPDRAERSLAHLTWLPLVDKLLANFVHPHQPRPPFQLRLLRIQGLLSLPFLLHWSRLLLKASRECY